MKDEQKYEFTNSGNQYEGQYNISLEQCRQLLGKRAACLDDADIARVRDAMYILADILCADIQAVGNSGRSAA